MKNTCRDLSNWFCLLVFVIILNYCEATLQQLNFLNSNQINEYLLLEKQQEFNYSQRRANDLKCLIELNAIQNGLKHEELWAMKTIDSWGKVPSGIFDGNKYELGAFSQCLNIERYDELYHSKYCLGHLFASSFKDISEWTSFSDVIFSTRLQTDSEPTIFEHIDSPQNRSLMLTFGLCLPAVCSMNNFEKLINEKADGTNQNISIFLDKNSCQFAENTMKLETIDKVAIGLLAIVLCLIISSTTYDIVCALKNRKKVEALLAFSFYTNGKNLFLNKKAKSTDMMHCIHGIRAVSIQWLILGQTYATYFSLPMRNRPAIPTFWEHQYHSAIIASVPFAIDTFLVLSGSLVSIKLLHFYKTRGQMIPFTYFNRYVRVTPILAISILLSVSLLRFLGNGPLFPSLFESFNEKCKRNWWTTILYVQNYANLSDMCFPHSWYIAMDMQLYLIVPVLVYLIYRLKAKALALLSLFILGCIGCTVATYLQNDIKNIFIKEETDYLTHIRFSPWLIGVMSSYFFYEARRRSIRISRSFNIFGWLISLSLMAMAILSNYPFTQSESKATAIQFGLYKGLSHIAWSISMCYIIFACVNDHGGPINCFLSHYLWQPVSRISYSIYLLHLPMMLVTMASMKAAPYFTDLTAWHTFIGNYVIIVIVAVIATLAFESPVIMLERIICGEKDEPTFEAQTKLPNPKSDETHSA